MEEKKLLEISGQQYVAIVAAFEEHKKMRGLPEHLKVLSKYNIYVETAQTTYTIRFNPILPKTHKETYSFGHTPFSTGYVLDKRNLKILKRFVTV